jgi:capsular exopolysaccharide synthesis family protein
MAACRKEKQKAGCNRPEVVFYMSYIFEALQRAEAERAGESVPKNAESVAELLQGVEQEIARKRAEAERLNESLPKGAESVIELTQEVEPSTTRTRPVSGQIPSVSQNAGSVADLGQEAEQGIARQQPEAGRAGGNLPNRVESVAALLPPVEVKVLPPQPVSELSAAVTTRPDASEAKRYPAVDTFADANVLSPTLATDSRLVCLTDQGGLPAEKFRLLGLKLRHMRDRRKLKRIVVTGTAPEEGKSLVAANLALNQARSKVLKTLLVDGDLRRPTVASRFGFDGSLPGLSECLRGEKRLSEVVYKLDGSGLWFLPAGRAPENPLDLMQSGRLPELLDQLGKFFDWIIIDTPPVVPVADTTFWMKLADGVLIVIREGVSEKKVVERAMDSFDRAALLGIVVNSCSRDDHEDYYSRYSHSAV